MFFITCFQKCEEDKYGLDTGATRTFGYYEDYETCKQALNENWCDMWEYLYDWAVVEKIGPGIHAHAEEMGWFKWNDDRQGFFEIEKPACTECYCNHALG